MGSSSGDDYSVPPQQPAPPGNLISPMGQATPYQPNFIDFLGNTNTPSTGLTPAMLAQIAATNGPPPGAMPPQTPQAPPQQQISPEAQRELLARNMMLQTGKQLNRVRVLKPGEMPPRDGFMGRGGNTQGSWR